LKKSQILVPLPKLRAKLKKLLWHLKNKI
jgi:hypothetical protein